MTCTTGKSILHGQTFISLYDIPLEIPSWKILSN